ncbi:MAG TPA: FKBP-type peptidyl-prolyl cis-trans isomerase N-terminal domain-containing protein, partial [Bacteroidia bacterium]|nr:FKBP-type peptidyl-prolyl cis-trans isomerase N-terminal domain-containing protein [Bacteroidia bacterium]
MNIKSISLAVVITATTLMSCNGQKGKNDVKLSNAADSTSYAIGLSIGTNLKKDGLNELNLDIMKKGMADVMKGDSLPFDMNTAQTVIQSYLGEKQKRKGDENLAAGKKFLEENGKKPGVVTTASGLQYQVIKEGDGPKPSATDTVTVHYHGTLIDGTVFDSSVD